MLYTEKVQESIEFADLRNKIQSRSRLYRNGIIRIGR